MVQRCRDKDLGSEGGAPGGTEGFNVYLRAWTLALEKFRDKAALGGPADQTAPGEWFSGAQERDSGALDTAVCPGVELNK